MGNCCGTNRNDSIAQADRLECPVNHQLCKPVSSVTVMHHVARPWDLSREEKAYYFCEDPNCNVVYFDNVGSIITQAQMRTTVGVKTDDHKALLCYCFGVSKQDYADTPTVKNFVIEQTKLKNCSCETKNPSGRCCLKNFSK